MFACTSARSKRIGNGIVVFSFITLGCVVIFMLIWGRYIKKYSIAEKYDTNKLCKYVCLFISSPNLFISGHLGGAILTAYGMVLPALLMLCCGIQFLYDKLIKSRFDIRIERMYGSNNERTAKGFSRWRV